MSVVDEQAFGVWYLKGRTKRRRVVHLGRVVVDRLAYRVWESSAGWIVSATLDVEETNIALPGVVVAVQNIHQRVPRFLPGKTAPNLHICPPSVKTAHLEINYIPRR